MQTPSFDRNDLGDQGSREVTQSVLGSTALGSTALMVAIDAQHRMAPPARAATTLISAGAIHRTLLAVSRANSY